MYCIGSVRQQVGGFQAMDWETIANGNVVRQNAGTLGPGETAVLQPYLMQRIEERRGYAKECQDGMTVATKLAQGSSPPYLELMVLLRFLGAQSSTIPRLDWRTSMTPTEYESLVAAHFAKLGYTTRQTAISGDYGVDVFAENAHERLAVQVKLYGHTTRRVNRQMVMELHGAKDYFDCDRAVLVTDGDFLPDAIEVAEKLGIQTLVMSAEFGSECSPAERNHRSMGTGASEAITSDIGMGGAETLSFDQIWTDHVMPLSGQVLHGKGTRTNTIEKVDWAGVQRISSTGQSSRIDIEIFRLAINHILRNGSITRDEINQNYAKRASSGVVLILSQVPLFELTDKPLKLHLSLADDLASVEG